MAKLEVNVWSDVACPWCWVGLQRFNRAVARVGDGAKVETKFHPYLIDPSTKKTGEEYLAYNKRRWGSDAWTASLRASGKPDGAAFEDWKWWPYTLKAHELIFLSEKEGLGSQAAKEALFRATYEEGENVSDIDVLKQVAERLGLQDVVPKLESGELDDYVMQADRHAKDGLDIRGVPHFVIGSGPKKVSLHGAQSIATFEQALKRQLVQLAAATSG